MYFAHIDDDQDRSAGTEHRTLGVEWFMPWRRGKMRQAAEQRVGSNVLNRIKGGRAPEERSSKAALEKADTKAIAGRPPLETSKNRDVLMALMDATNQCLEKTTASELTVRQIADTAHVNQAMIHYYFENKEGLYSSVNEHKLIELSRSIENFLKDLEYNPDTSNDLEGLIELIEEYFDNNPGLYLMNVHGDVDFNSGMHKKYSSGLAGRSYSRISKIVSVLQKKGMCRSDISTKQIAYIICAYCGFPTLINPTFFNLAFKGDMACERALRRQVIVRMLAPLPNSD